jgi:predicted transcriptional regulator
LAVTIQERVNEALRTLPEDAQIEDAMERLLFLAKIERGVNEADNNETLSHEDVKQRVSKWLK